MHNRQRALRQPLLPLVPFRHLQQLIDPVLVVLLALRDLLKVGEQTGDLGIALDKVGARYEKEIQLKIDRIMSIVPMLIIGALGLMVVLIAWSMLEGIFKVMQDLQGRQG